MKFENDPFCLMAHLGLFYLCFVELHAENFSGKSLETKVNLATETREMWTWKMDQPKKVYELKFLRKSLSTCVL